MSYLSFNYIQSW